MANLLDALQEACLSAGIVFKNVPADGRWHKTDVIDDPRGRGDGRIKLFTDGEGGRVQNWKNGESPQTFFIDSKPILDEFERRERDKKRQEYIKRDQEEEERRHSEAATEAERIWKAATPAPADHSYLTRKGVQAHGLKLHNGALVVPIHDEGRTLHSLQFIDPEGGKRFLPGGRVQGCYHAFGGNPATAGTLCLVEGYATGASVHAATAYPVAVAFDAGKLKAVALAMRAKFPDVRLIICADDDHGNPVNTGLTKATEAAQAIGGLLAVPNFGPDRPDRASDFNDLAAHLGLEAVRAQIEKAQAPAMPNPAPAPEVPPRVQGAGTRYGVEVPDGWHLDQSGVYLLKESKNDDGPPLKIFISDPASVLALNRNEQGESWGILVRFTDLDGRERELAIPRGRLHEQGPGLAQDFALAGLRIVSGKEGAFKSYLGAFNPKARRICTDRLGWADTDDGRLVFVLPNEVIGTQGAEGVVFQPEHYAPTTTTIKAAGTLEEWQQGVAIPCAGNPFLMFAVCSALAGPLLKPSGLDGGGFHFYGRSSHGKTTAAQVAASVWGCGADPAAASDRAFVRRWNTTANALEGLAAAHNDILLILDELGTCTAKDAGAIVYNLAGGQGKGRMTSAAALRQQRSWRVFFLSTGEIPILAKIEEEGKTAHAGQLLRCLDIPTEAGIIADPHGQQPKDFADKLKRGCSTHYGAAGPAFLSQLIGRMEHYGQLKAVLVQLLQGIEPQLTPENATPEQARAFKRFALVCAAGVLGVRLGVLPWEESAISDAVEFVKTEWLNSNHNLSDVDRGVNGVRDFLMRYATRFQALGRDDPPPHNRAGFKKDGIYYFTDEAFKEACEGHTPKDVAKRIKELGHLHFDEVGRDKARLPQEMDGRRPRFYAVKVSILEGADNDN